MHKIALCMAKSPFLYSGTKKSRGHQKLNLLKSKGTCAGASAYASKCTVVWFKTLTYLV